MCLGLFGLSQTALAQDIDYGKIDRQAQQLVDRNDMVGLAIGIVENGEITFARGYGVREPNGAPVDENTVFRWASLSKGVAGSLVGQLADEGKLSLSDTVADFDTSLRLPNNGQRRATLSHVLSHQLGIVSNAYDGRLEDGRKPADIRKALGALKNVCALATCHTYQNVAFDVVSEIVEAATGQSYQDIAQLYLFDPLGMQTASLTRQDILDSGNYAKPFRKYRRDNAPKPTDLNDSYYNVPAAGGVNSSITDLARYMQAQMGLQPEILPEAVLNAIHEPQTQTLREVRSMKRRYGRITSAEYGLGWRVYDYAGHRVVGHRGAVRGYRAMIFFDPELDTGIVAMWNSNASKPVGLQFEFMDMVYGLPEEDWLKLELQTAEAQGTSQGTP